MSLDNISFIYTTQEKLASEKQVKVTLDICFSNMQITKPVCFVFMSDNELLDVNRQTLNHDYFTDVITFDYSKDEDMDCNEVLVSIDRVKENALTQNVTFITELYRICIHGMLHLEGHLDATTEDKNKMTELEDHYLALYCST